ncbi:ROK family protein [Nicoliella lavandulae]|uniref:fructokinase n=1 Tax=Nicoliella lavandulae TaxID=3082954 RepID=A0ABU8SJI2_9LACO
MKGFGAGIVNDGELIGYQGSPEIGHIYPERHPDDQTFKGTCPYQGDCLEGLVAEPAFEARFGKSYKEISMFEPIWDIVAYYIAQSAIQATLLMRPQKIILGGDIVNEVELQKIKQQFQKLLNNYVEVGPIDDYLVAPSNSSRKLSIVGNLSLAKKEFYSASDVTMD